MQSPPPFHRLPLPAAGSTVSSDELDAEPVDGWPTSSSTPLPHVRAHDADLPPRVLVLAFASGMATAAAVVAWMVMR